MFKQFRQQILPSQEKGFTLIEILIAAFIGTLIILTMFGFLQGVLRRDEQESARASSQEEIQAAIGFIADDLREATYIYDATGIAAIEDQLPHMQAPVQNDRFPVLVFWKRERLDRSDTIENSGNGSQTKRVACFPTSRVNPSDWDDDTSANYCEGGDQFVLSLVAYYLIKGDNSSTSIWSNTARIARWSIRGGVLANIGCYETDITTCQQALRTDTPAPPDPNADTNPYYLRPSIGFRNVDFDLPGAENLSDIYNAWEKLSNTNRDYEVLADFIDDSPLSLVQSLNLLQVEDDNDCIQFTGDDPATPGNDSQRVPEDFATLPTQVNEISGFYACVNSLGVNNRGSVVQVFLRGNALARINDLGTPTVPYLPTATIKAIARSTIVPD